MSEQIGHQQHEIEDIGDHISNLPNCILHHILSCIPTKEVVRTSVLSTRWKNLWDSVHNLDVDAREVDDWDPPKVTSFLKFLERVLKLHGASNIKKFRLTCSRTNEESQVHSWIFDAIRNNVQELELHLYEGAVSKIPWSILHTTSLVSLTMTRSYFRDFTFCISLPCLKTLLLQFPLGLNDGQIENLLLVCPVIEELFLLDIWMNLRNVRISSSTLKRLTIRDNIIDDPTCEIKIDAANLTYFEYIGYGYQANEIILNNTLSLVKSRIEILPYNANDRWQKLAASRAVNLLKRLQFVESLSVSETTIQGFEQCKDLGGAGSIWSPLPKWFSNSLKTVTLKDFCGNDLEIRFLKRILKYACVLERLDIWWCENYVQEDLNRKTEVTKELENIERSSTACVINFL